MYEYQYFMQPYLRAAMEEQCKFLGTIYEEAEEVVDDDPGEVSGEEASKVYKENYLFRDTLQKVYVSPKLTKPRYREAMIAFVAKFIDEHSTELSKSGPVNIIPFGDKETEFLYTTFEITKEQVLQIYENVIQETYYGTISKFISGWINKAPHKLLIVAILAEAIQSNYEDIVECCEYLLAFTEYPIIYREYWKINAREDIMNYTIEHLGTKYKVKKVSNLQGLLKWDGHSTVARYVDLFKAGGADNVWIDLLRRLRNQVNNTLKNIARAYYKNAESNASQHSTVTKFDDGSLADKEGVTTNTAQVINQTITKMATSDINNAFVRVCAEQTRIDEGNLRGYISQIMSTKDNKIPKFVEDVITAYFIRFPMNDSLVRGEFLPFGIALYRSISTSKDPIYKEIRQIVDYWMIDIINIRAHYQRDATVSCYTRGIFNYFILMINYYN